MELGRLGIVVPELRSLKASEAVDAVTELDELGFSTLWLPGIQPDMFGDAQRFLSATSRMKVASGVLNVWMHDANTVIDGYHSTVARFPDRFLLGVGVGHSIHPVDRTPKPVDKMTTFLDRLDAARPAIPRNLRILAALGDRMLRLARDRASGAYPALATPAHTHRARELLTSARLLAVGQPVVLDTDTTRARSRARTLLGHLIGLPNYRRSFVRMGFDEDDLEGGGSDRLVDALVVLGDEDAVRRRVDELCQAGADQVVLYLVHIDRHRCRARNGDASDPRSFTQVDHPRVLETSTLLQVASTRIGYSPGRALCIYARVLT